MTISKIIKRLQKKGFKVSYMSGTRNGNMSIVGVVAVHQGTYRRIQATSMNALNNKLTPQ